MKFFFYLTLVVITGDGGMGCMGKEPLGGSDWRKEEIMGATVAAASKKRFYKHRADEHRAL